MKIIQFFKEFNASMDASADNYVAKHHNEKLFLSWIIFFSMCVFLGSICAILIFTGIVPPMNNRWAVWQYSFMTIVALRSTIHWQNCSTNRKP